MNSYISFLGYLLTVRLVILPFRSRVVTAASMLKRLRDAIKKAKDALTEQTCAIERFIQLYSYALRLSSQHCHNVCSSILLPQFDLNKSDLQALREALNSLGQAALIGNGVIVWSQASCW